MVTACVFADDRTSNKNPPPTCVRTCAHLQPMIAAFPCVSYTLDC
jgi:hypothetical protein